MPSIISAKKTGDFCRASLPLSRRAMVSKPTDQFVQTFGFEIDAFERAVASAPDALMGQR